MEAKILIQFPTRQRPEKFLYVAKKYIDLLNNKADWVMNVSCDEDDESMNNPRMIERIYNLAPDSQITLNFNPNQNKIDAINADVDSLEFDILILASDDMIPRERGYDNIIRKYFNNYFPTFDGVLHFDDGHQHEKLNTLCILGRYYYERFHYIYHPTYISLWADNEFSEVSRTLGKSRYIEEVIIKHEHPASNSNILTDDLYIKNNTFELTDRTNYRKRKLLNFNL